VWRAITTAEEFGAWFGVKLEGVFAEGATVRGRITYSRESTTLVEFRLAEADGSTVLTIVESGFDHIPIARRAEAFRRNDGGWTEQVTNIERHVSQP
jgi:hypothetical protein